MSALTGTGRLLRLAVRRDRIVVPCWLAAVAGLGAGTVGGVASLYATAEERATAAAFTAASVPSRAFSGPASGTEPGAIALVEAFLVLAILVALMSIQAVVRHTRRDEEAGRAELLGSAVVGRQARLAAALLLAAGASLGAGVAFALVLLAGGLATTGSVAAGAALAGVGLVFAAVAAVTAQVFASGRAATAGAAAVLGVAFRLRAVGDAGGEVAASGVELTSAWPSWLSPLGWGQQVRAFHQDRWAVLALFPALTLLLAALAAWLGTRRDVGAGLVPDRPGPAVAGRLLRRHAGLAWRLHRSTLVGWSVGMAVVAAAFGAIGDEAGEFAAATEELQRALGQLADGGAMTELFLAFTMSFLAVAAAGFTVQTLLRMRIEEADGRLEPLLAAAVARTGWLGGHLAIAAVGTVVLLGATGSAGAVAFGAVTGDWSTAGGVLRAALVQIPAVLALGGVVVLAFGVAPRQASAIGWAALAASLVVGQLGALFELPQAVLNLSPFTHVPAVPAEAFRWEPTVWLLGAALVQTAVGAVAFRRRDLAIAA